MFQFKTLRNSTIKWKEINLCVYQKGRRANKRGSAFAEVQRGVFREGGRKSY